MNQSALAQWKIPPLAAAGAAQPHYHNLFNWRTAKRRRRLQCLMLWIQKLSMRDHEGSGMKIWKWFKMIQGWT